MERRRGRRGAKWKEHDLETADERGEKEEEIESRQEHCEKMKTQDPFSVLILVFVFPTHFFFTPVDNHQDDQLCAAT